MNFWSESNWLALPNKKQLGLIFMIRFCETFVMSSTATFLFLQLQSFSKQQGSTPDASVTSSQLSWYFAALNAPQLLTSIFWGRMTDMPWMGRKNVLLLGLIAKGVLSISLAFAKSFHQVLAWSCLVGATSNNLATMRTMIREMVSDEFQSRAMLLLPIALNMGFILAPPVAAFELHFQPEFAASPYVLPHLLNALCILLSAAAAWWNLEDTFADKSRPSRGCSSLSLLWKKESAKYKLLTRDPESYDLDDSLVGQDDASPKPSIIRLWTSRLSLVLVARGLMACQIGAYQMLLTSFLYTSRAAKHDGEQPLGFSGGLAFQTDNVAAALSFRGLAGLFLQMVFFPYLKARLGLLRLYQVATVLLPISYFITPFLAIIPTTTTSNDPAPGILLWTILLFVLLMQTIGRSFALPASVMLLNEACPHPSLLGTTNGIGQAVSAAGRTFGPALFGWLYGLGLSNGVVGLAWWALTITAILGSLASYCIKQ